MHFHSGAPIWQQLLDEFTRKIIVNEWPSGSKIPSTRDLALQFGVNPNTVQRTLAALDQTGMTHSERTAGRFVSDNPETLQQLREDSATHIVDEAIAKLKGLTVSLDETRELLERRWNNDD